MIEYCLGQMQLLSACSRTNPGYSCLLQNTLLMAVQRGKMRFRTFMIGASTAVSHFVQAQ